MPGQIKFKMPTYVFLVTLTEKGKSRLEEVRRNAKELTEFIKTLDGQIKGSFMTLGRYDMVEIVELPNDISALKLSMKSTESGLQNVETLKGFTEKELEFITA